MKLSSQSGLKKMAYVAVLCTSLAMGAVVAKVPLPPVVRPGLISYYSDASKTQQVGLEIITCEGVRYFLWGASGVYRDQELFYCQPPIES